MSSLLHFDTTKQGDDSKFQHDVSCPTNVVRVQSEFTRSPNGKEHFVLNFLVWSAPFNFSFNIGYIGSKFSTYELDEFLLIQPTQLRVVKMKIERFTFKYPKAPRTMAIYIFIFIFFGKRLYYYCFTL